MTRDRQPRVLHAIHDFLPRHRAGSEIYAWELCRALAPACHVSVLAAEHDLQRTHGHLTWRLQDGLTLVEVVNNWVSRHFADTYESPLITAAIEQTLDAVQPDVVHLHSLLNLSFALPEVARARGIPVVATVHDYSLVCAAGGQRVHRADSHVCHAIEPQRCVRCVRESPFHDLAVAGRASAIAGGADGADGSRPLRRARIAAGGLSAARGAMRRLPAVAAAARRWSAQATAAVAPSEADIARRLARAADAWRQLDLIVAPSASLATEFARLGFPADKVVVSDYGFSESARERTPRTTARSGPVRFGFLGTIVWHKGLHVLLAAAQQLAATGWAIEIHGDPGTFPDYTGELRTIATGRPVHFRGAYDHQHVGDILSGLDALIVPSIWLENSPLVIHEAFLAGVPVIGARIGGIAGLVQDGVNGLLYDPWSPDDLARVLARVIDEPDLLERLRTHRSPVKTIQDDAADWLVRYAGVRR